MHKAISGRISHLDRGLLRPLWSWLFAGLVGALSLVDWLRQALPLDSELKSHLDFMSHLPLLTPLGWSLLFMASLLVVLFEGTYRSQLQAEGRAKERISELETKIDVLKDRRPKIRIECQQIMWGGTDPSEQFQNGCPVTITMSVFNAGSPSILVGWSLFITTDDGQTMVGSPIFVGKTASFGSGRQQMTLLAKDAIYEKSAIPIPEGGMITGFLLAFFERIEPKDMVGKHLFVRCEDVLANEVIGDFGRIGEGSNRGFVYLPAMNMSVKQES